MRASSYLLLLGAIALFTWRMAASCPFPIWISFFLLSIALSMSIAYLQARDDKEALELIMRQKECLSVEVEGLRVAHKRLAEERAKEREEWNFIHERAENLQLSLEEALKELKKWQQQGHFERELLEAAHISRHQYLQLRKQFEEKGEELKEARRSYYELESLYLACVREYEELKLERQQEAEENSELALIACEEVKDLEAQTEQLEELVTHLLETKKQAPRKKKNPQNEVLELQF